MYVLVNTEDNVSKTFSCLNDIDFWLKTQLVETDTQLTERTTRIQQLESIIDSIRILVDSRSREEKQTTAVKSPNDQQESPEKTQLEEAFSGQLLSSSLSSPIEFDRTEQQKRLIITENNNLIEKQYPLDENVTRLYDWFIATFCRKYETKKDKSSVNIVRWCWRLFIRIPEHCAKDSKMVDKQSTIPEAHLNLLSSYPVGRLDSYTDNKNLANSNERYVVKESAFKFFKSMLLSYPLNLEYHKGNIPNSYNILMINTLTGYIKCEIKPLPTVGEWIAFFTQHQIRRKDGKNIKSSDLESKCREFITKSLSLEPAISSIILESLSTQVFAKNMEILGFQKSRRSKGIFYNNVQDIYDLDEKEDSNAVILPHDKELDSEDLKFGVF